MNRDQSRSGVNMITILCFASGRDRKREKMWLELGILPCPWARLSDPRIPLSWDFKIGKKKSLRKGSQK